MVVLAAVGEIVTIDVEAAVVVTAAVAVVGSIN